MLSAALEHERLLIAERLLSEIERRHGLPHPDKREIHPVITDRFLATYLPEAREGEPAPLALEYAFAPNLSDALRLLQEVVTESADGTYSRSRLVSNARSKGSSKIAPLPRPAPDTSDRA